MTLWMLSVALAEKTVEVPSSGYPTVEAACDDVDVTTIVVLPEAEPGGSCLVSRDLTIQAGDPELRSSVPLISVSGDLVLEGPLEIVEDDSGEAIAVHGGRVTSRDLRLDGGDRGGFYGLRLDGGEFVAVDLEVVGFYQGLYVQGEGSVLRVEGGALSDNGLAVGTNNTALGSHVDLEGLDFTGNDGGVHLQAGGGSITDSRFKGNGGTQISLGSGSSAELAGLAFIENDASSGVIYGESDLAVRDSFFCGNQGPAVWVDGVKVDLVDVGFVANTLALVGTDATVVADHVSLVADGEGFKMSSGSLRLTNSLLWESSAIAADGVSVSGEHNAYPSRPPAMGPGEGDLEITDPGFWSGFVADDCSTRPWLAEDSPLLGAASDGGAIGAYGAWTEEQQDTGLGDSGAGGRSWFSGGCGGALPAMLVLLIPGLALTRRR
jgi:hypothetical protein